MNLIEQVGRYACIVLMWLPLLVWKFGFASVLELLLCLGGNGLLAGFSSLFAVGHIYVTNKNLEAA